MTDAVAALLLLADGRFPSGAYAHSGGLEPAVADGRVRELADLESFLHGRVETVGVMYAAFAAAACVSSRDRNRPRLDALDRGMDVRMPSPAQRATSRQLGRQMLRAVAVIGPKDRLVDPAGRDAHQAVALGCAAAVLGLDPRAAAGAALHETAAGVIAASVRLLAIDPLRGYARVAGFAPRLDQLADAAAALAIAEVDALPAPATPLLDVYAERHAARTARLFSS